MEITDTSATLSGTQQPSRSFFLPGVAIGLNLAILALVVTTRETFRQLIIDMEIEMTSVTKLALSPVLPGLLFVVLMATIVLLTAARRHQASRIGYQSAIVLVLVCLAAYIAGVFAPLMQILQGLS